MCIKDKCLSRNLILSNLNMKTYYDKPTIRVVPIVFFKVVVDVSTSVDASTSVDVSTTVDVSTSADVIFRLISYFRNLRQWTKVASRDNGATQERES